MNIDFLQRVIINNLNIVFRYNNIESLKDAAKFIGINYSTLRSWMAFERQPSIETLDEICNKFKIPTYFLFIPNFSDSLLSNSIEFTENNSKRILKDNLKKLYKERGKNNWNEIESIYFGLLSRETLKSYHRNKDFIVPPISTLEKMCSYLAIPAYKILGGESDAI